MLTFFTAPKPFVGHTDIIQRNAIQSWLQSATKSQVLLFGEEERTACIATELGVQHVPDIQRSPHGAPLLDGIFQRACELADYRTLCFVNSDIIFNGGFDLLESLSAPFLVVGESMDLPVEARIDFSNPNWRATLGIGNSRGPFALDYFIFSKELFRSMPPFRVGRARYDNWMVWHALRSNATVVDATSVLAPIHQNHDYTHLRGGRNEAYRGRDAKFNQKLAGLGCYWYLYSVSDARWILTQDGLLPHRNSFGFSKQVLRRLKGWITERFRLTKIDFEKNSNALPSNPNSAER